MRPNSDILPPCSQEITRIDRLARNTLDLHRRLIEDVKAQFGSSAGPFAHTGTSTGRLMQSRRWSAWPPRRVQFGLGNLQHNSNEISKRWIAESRTIGSLAG